MTSRSVSSAPVHTPQQSAVRKLQRIQQNIIRLNTQFSHVLAGFNLALERLGMHLSATSAPAETARPADAKTAQLGAQVDRLAHELEELTTKLDALMHEFSAGHEELGTLLGLRTPEPGPDSSVMRAHESGAAVPVASPGNAPQGAPTSRTT